MPLQLEFSDLLNLTYDDKEIKERFSFELIRSMDISVWLFAVYRFFREHNEKNVTYDFNDITITIEKNKKNL